MIGRIILNVLVIAVIVIFLTLNLGTKVDIHFWFNNLLTIKEAPLPIALIISFVTGALSTLPVYLVKKFHKKKKQIIEVEEKEEDEE